MDTQSLWLIDASQINVGGAVAILKMVVTELDSQGINYLVIKDKRLKSGIIDDNRCYTPDQPIIKRKSTYRKLISDYKVERVVSLISIAPPIKLDVPVHTYFHNVNLLKGANLSNSGPIYKMMQFLKNRYIRSKLKNTDFYSFQSSLIRDAFLKDFNYDLSRCNIFPFYDEEEIHAVKAQNLKKVKSSFIYVSSDYPHKNHIRLLKSWQSLFEQGYTPTLTLTVPVSNKALYNRIADLNAKGCKIKNLGVTEYRICLEQTALSEYCIFPSLSESLGLGLVEGQLLDCKVLVSDMEYAYQAVKPSAVFDPYNVDSITQTVLEAITQSIPNTELRMSNKLKDWIDFVGSSH